MVFGLLTTRGKIVVKKSISTHRRYTHPCPIKEYNDLLTCIEHIWWKILDECINACWVYSIKSVSKM